MNEAVKQATSFHAKRFGLRLLARVRPFFDMSAWVLVWAAMLPLYFIDPAMTRTIAQWSLVALALAGIGVVISRVVFPNLDFGEWVTRAKNGQDGAAVIVGAVVIGFSISFLALVLWAKA